MRAGLENWMSDLADSGGACDFLAHGHAPLQEQHRALHRASHTGRCEVRCVVTSYLIHCSPFLTAGQAALPRTLHAFCGRSLETPISAGILQAVSFSRCGTACQMTGALHGTPMLNAEQVALLTYLLGYCMSSCT